MTDHEHNSQNYPSHDDIVAAIYSGDQPHSGQVPVEQGGERPVDEFDTPLHEAIGTHIDPDVQPNDASGVQLHPGEHATIDQSTAAVRNDRLEQDQPQSNLKKWVAGIVTLAVLGGAGGYFATRGHDSSHEATGPNQQPGTSASPNPGKTETTPAAAENKPTKTVLDPAVDGSIKPLSQTVMQEQFDTQAPTDFELEMTANIPPDALFPFVKQGAFQQLVNKYPNWTGLADFYQKYGTDVNPYAMSTPMADKNFLANVYNNDYAGAAQLYSQPMTFRDPDTAKTLAKTAPYVPISDFEQAAQNGDFPQLWNKLNPDISLGQAFVKELEAGNNDPNLVNEFTQLTMLRDESMGAVTTGSSRQDDETANHKFFADIEAKYHKLSREQFSKAMDEQFGFKITTNKVEVLAAGRQKIGSQYGLDNEGTDKKFTVSSLIVYKEYTVTFPDGTKSKQGSIELDGLFNAPIKGSNHQYVQAVTVDRTSAQLSQ